MVYCTKCGGNLREMLGRYGKFYACEVCGQATSVRRHKQRSDTAAKVGRIIDRKRKEAKK